MLSRLRQELLPNRLVVMVKHKTVPPTPYYYGLRAELHRKNALAALSNSDTEKYLLESQLCVKYSTLAQQLDLEEYDNHTERKV